jgi:5-methyltetrahydropteroyltriglutamate--homocysteine methyltransferase
MCGALGERGEKEEELRFALALLNRVTESFPLDRLAMHVCRGNWSPDETVALTGGYEQLLPVLQEVRVGTLFLEFCTPRAGDIAVLEQLPEGMRIGLGVVNPKDSAIESVDEICKRVTLAAQHVALDRILLTPDCGFATFADNPVASGETAVRKLTNMKLAAGQLQKLLR